VVFKKRGKLGETHKKKESGGREKKRKKKYIELKKRRDQRKKGTRKEKPEPGKTITGTPENSGAARNIIQIGSKKEGPKMQRERNVEQIA